MCTGARVCMHATPHDPYLSARITSHLYLGRQTYMSEDLCFTTNSFFLSSSFFRQLPAQLAERNGYMVGSNCDLKMHVWNVGYPSPYKSGAQKPLFPRFRNLRANITAYIFGTKHNIHKRGKCVANYKGSPTWLHRLKTTWTLVHKWRQIGGEFSPTLRRLCFP